MLLLINSLITIPILKFILSNYSSFTNQSFQILAALDTVRMMLYLIDVHIYDMLVSLAEKGMPYVPYPYRDEIYVRLLEIVFA